MNLAKSNQVKKILKNNSISELRLAYSLGVNRSTVSNKLQLPLSQSNFKRMVSAIKKINRERKNSHDD